VAAGLPLAALPVLVDSRAWGLWAAYLLGCAALTAIDAARTPLPSSWRVSFKLPKLLQIGSDAAAEATVERASGRIPACWIEALFELDAELEQQPPQGFAVPIAGAPALAVRAILRPRRRGRVAISALWLRWQGPWRLVYRMRRIAADHELSVIPNIAAVRAAALRFFNTSEFLAGTKRERYVGDGSEFDSLRDYQPGWDPRGMDWKASARRRKLLCREFQAERNHQILLAYDTGHQMREPISGIPRLDHAINAGLLLSYVCLRQGDRVGLLGFDAEVRSYLAPRRGMLAMSALQSAAGELDYSVHESNYTLALTELSRRLRRRSLVVLLTEFLDTVTAQLMIENVERLRRRHPVILVALRDPWLLQVAEAEPRDPLELQRSVVARALLLERERVFGKLRRLGVRCVNAAPGAVTTRLLNAYLDVKRRELMR
jgi:uncharacterized protein (DUF58 family)